MTINNNQPDHDEIMTLLPWFVNKTLDSVQMDIVSNHLEDCVECQREIQFLDSMNNAIQSDANENYSTHAHVSRDLENVLNRIDAHEKTISIVEPKASLLQRAYARISDYLSFSPLGLQGAVALASVLIVVAALQFQFSKTGDDYTVLSSPEENGSVVRLSVVLDQSVDREEARSAMRSLFDKQGQPIEFEEGGNGNYILTINEPIEVGALNEFVLDLNGQHVVKKVEILP